MYLNKRSKKCEDIDLTCNELENSKYGNFLLNDQKKYILINNHCEGIICDEMNNKKYDSFILDEPTKKCIININKNKCEELDIINCNEMSINKYEFFIPIEL